MVDHHPEFRRSWMFPRNIRKIHPWKITQLISIFAEVGSNNNWSRDQNLQNDFSKKISAAGLKSSNNLRDSHSGGARTYKSQLELLGLIFDHESGAIGLTLAGQLIYDGEPPLQILQALLLRFQYPSVYSRGQNVKIHPDIKVKPFHFCLKIMNDPRINGITVDELCIPVLLGHTNEDLESCVEAILNLRTNKLSPISILEADLSLGYTIRAKNRSVTQTFKDVHDIANTLKNYLESCHLITASDNGERFVLAEGVETLLVQQEEKFNIFIEIDDRSEESFQRLFGTIGRLKDNRRNTTQPSHGRNSVLFNSQNEIIKDPEIESIKRFLRRELNENPADFSLKKFVINMYRDHGFDKIKVENVYKENYEEFIDQFEATFLDLAIGGTTKANQFEKTVTRLLNDVNGLKAIHIGQKNRVLGTGGYADILIDFIENKEVALIDTKASPNYSLPSSDFSKITSNYIRNYEELAPSSGLLFFTLIAGNFSKGVAKKLVECKEITNVPTSAISARAFLHIYKLAKSGIITIDKFKKPFISSKIISIESIDDYLR